MKKRSGIIAAVIAALLLFSADAPAETVIYENTFDSLSGVSSTIDHTKGKWTAWGLSSAATVLQQPRWANPPILSGASEPYFIARTIRRIGRLTFPQVNLLNYTNVKLKVAVAAGTDRANLTPGDADRFSWRDFFRISINNKTFVEFVGGNPSRLNKANPGLSALTWPRAHQTITRDFRTFTFDITPEFLEGMTTAVIVIRVKTLTDFVGLDTVQVVGDLNPTPPDCYAELDRIGPASAPYVGHLQGAEIFDADIAGEERHRIAMYWQQSQAAVAKEARFIVYAETGSPVTAADVVNASKHFRWYNGFNSFVDNWENGAGSYALGSGAGQLPFTVTQFNDVWSGDGVTYPSWKIRVDLSSANLSLTAGQDYAAALSFDGPDSLIWLLRYSRPPSFVGKEDLWAHSIGGEVTNGPGYCTQSGSPVAQYGAAMYVCK